MLCPSVWISWVQSKSDIKGKVEALQQLFDELLSDEAKAMYRELQALMRAHAPMQEVQKTIKEIADEEAFLEKELERTLSLFKRFQFEFSLNEAIERAKKMETHQEDLSHSFEKGDEGERIRAQRAFQQAFRATKEQVEEAEALNKALEHPYDMESFAEDLSAIESAQAEAQKHAEAGNFGKAQRAQEEAEQHIKALQRKLEHVQTQMNITSPSIQLEKVQELLAHLIDLSFLQEEVMEAYQKVATNNKNAGSSGREAV